MPRRLLQHALVGDTDAFRPSRQRPVRVRARTMPADTHFEPHSHAWSQVAYCASGILQVTAQQGGDSGDEVTYIIPPSRAVWIEPGARHAIHVLEAAQFQTLYIDASATPKGWSGCRVIVVSPLLRELVQALDAAAPGEALPRAREERLSGLVLDEIANADIHALGVPLPNAQTGDKRLRALCEAVLHAPSQRATLAGWSSEVGASERTMGLRLLVGPGLQLIAPSRLVFR